MASAGLKMSTHIFFYLNTTSSANNCETWLLKATLISLNYNLQLTQTYRAIAIIPLYYTFDLFESSHILPSYRNLSWRAI